MARALSPTYMSKTGALGAKTMHFQRGKGMKKVKKKKIKKKITLRFKHITFFFFFIGGIFYFIQQAYIFLISWDYLNTKEIIIICPKERVRQEVEQLISKKTLGNILLLDISYLRETLEAQNWVKEAQIRKIFPSSLRIKIIEREPIAILQKDDLYLIDEKGIKLERIFSKEKINLPLLIDSHNFQKNYEEKLTLAWECLKSLPASEKEKIKTLDLTDYGRICVFLKNEPTKIILGRNQFVEKLKFFHEHQKDLELRFGPLEYVDLRFQDRIYIKPQTKLQRSVIPNSGKEVQ